MHTFLKT